MSRLTRIALCAYPPSFRARYGGELSALVEDLPPGSRSAANLLYGAALAWLHPRNCSARRRMQATTTTTWVAWCAGFLLVPAASRALLDPPSPGMSGAAPALLNIAWVAFFVGWASVLLGAAPIVARAVVPALRTRNWSSLRPTLPALIFGALVIAGLIWLAITSQSRAASLDSPPPLVIGLAAGWLASVVAFACSLGIGPAVSVTRLEPAVDALRMPTRLAVPTAVSLATLAGCSLAAILLGGNAALFGSEIPVLIAATVGCGAALIALISAGRGVRALQAA